MMTTFRGWSLGCVISGALIWAMPVQAQEAEGVVRLGGSEAAGVIRISDQKEAGPVVRGQSEEATLSSEIEQAGCRKLSSCPQESVTYCPENYVVDEHCRECRHSKWHNWLHHGGDQGTVWFNGHCAKKNHGPGRPLAGCYHMVYPVDPGYFDQRDGQVYAAPGYGGPVSVPLAPVVKSSYNYGWGVPSSRLTPILHPATQAPVSQIPSPYPHAPIAR